MRYFLGFIMGVLLVSATQYKLRFKNTVRSVRRLITSMDKAHYTGCLSGKKLFRVASESEKVFCKAKTSEYMEYFRKLYVGSK